MYHDTDGWIEQYAKKGALWIHDGDMRRPHALLTSGNHSSGFFNSELVMEDPTLLDEASFDLVKRLVDSGLNMSIVDRVVGPAMGAITMTHSIAASVNYEKIITEHHLPKSSPRCLRAYVEKEPAGNSYVMQFKRTQIRSGERILSVEDVLTTGGSVSLMVEAIELDGGIPLQFVAVLVNRSGLKDVNGMKIVSLIDRSMPMWEPDVCPLCEAGSEAVRPKGSENWARLNATY